MEVTKSAPRRRTQLIVAAVVLSLLIAGVVAVTTITNNSKNGLTAVQVANALCVLRADLQSRVDTQVQFLADHPNGIPGIPAKVILDGINNQKRTVVALQSLDCPPPK